ncbi:MAG: aldehyde dehydrogenase family protein [Cryomorphaceae bacterium]|nr:MAG: aldehyde dehydrogenase family protein [Cryomorphaceae bacterium]
MADSTTKNKKKVAATNGNGSASKGGRVEVLKTYKLYIGGAFPRTESGRYTKLKNAKGEVLANVCRASRKDFRNAVSAAGKALPGWSGRSAFNRSQVLYRMAEMMEQRAPLLVAEMVQMGYSTAKAKAEVELCIDRTVHYAGWCDKYTQIFSSVNPVASAHFNFSLPEPMGVVTAVAGNDTALLSLLSNLLPVIAGGNTAVVLASEKYPLSAITLAEIINDSDVPGGVVNLLTGQRDELYTHMAGHMGVHGLIVDDCPAATAAKLQEQCTDNLKRFFDRHHDWTDPDTQNPYLILDTQEIKTTWHPIEVIDGKGSGY